MFTVRFLLQAYLNHSIADGHLQGDQRPLALFSGKANQTSLHVTPHIYGVLFAAQCPPSLCVILFLHSLNQSLAPYLTLPLYQQHLSPIGSGWGCLFHAAMTTRTPGFPSLLFPWGPNRCCCSLTQI